MFVTIFEVKDIFGWFDWYFLEEFDFCSIFIEVLRLILD